MQMRYGSSRDKLWHTPLTLSVMCHGKSAVIPIDKRYITICKHKLQCGNSAELFRDGSMVIVFTKLGEHDAAISVQHNNTDIASVMIQNRAFQEQYHQSETYKIQGLARFRGSGWETADV